MGKIKKIIYTVLSLAPLGTWILFSVLTSFSELNNSSHELFTIWDLYPGFLGKLSLAAIFIGFIFSIYMAIKVFNNNFVPKSNKTIWGILLIFLNVFVLPIFWAIYVRKSTE